MTDPCKDVDNWIKVEQFHFCKFPDGRNKFAVFFDEGSAWVPKWQDMHQMLKYGLRTEIFNRKWANHGRPRRYFVKELVGILNDEGYDVREFRQVRHEPTLQHEFFVDAVASDGTGFSDVVSIAEDNFAKAKAKARRQFMDRLRNRLKDTRWSNLPLKVVDMRRKTYKLVDSDYEVVEKEEASF